MLRCTVLCCAVLSYAMLSSTVLSVGSEIYLRRPSRYHAPTDEPETFAQIGELARTKKETAIGYITKAGLMKLAPRPKTEHTYQPDDRIIVIADD